MNASIPNLPRRRIALAGAAALALPGLARAEPAPAAWPTRPIHLLVGFPGGSTPDMAARVLADALAAAYGQPVVVDNRPGASGNIAADLVAKARDDHQLGVVINGNLTVARMLNPHLPFDPAHDFAPLSLLATAPLLLVAPAGAPTGAAFFDAARHAKSQWNYGSVGIGSVGHLGMELLAARAGFHAVHIPYNGNPAVVTALIAGQIQAALMPPGVALPQVRAGKLTAIGLTGGRSALAPAVPPLSEFGPRLDELEVWVALVGPARLSAAAQTRLAHDLPTLLRAPASRQRLFNAGWQLQGSSPEALRLRIAQETRVLGAIIRAQHIQAA
ncbi:MAG: tripartite tricarboxylate transporter substrate binding protein [Burkholderiales bacterium]|nr:tripartite tricarboxylate transporter substrate binding protein [Burkholderiales bacterium]